jgi:hypothetical protein
MRKRTLVVSDLHCGASTGLTPLNPKWKQTELSETLYRLYLKWINELGPFDIAIVNGDAIDGTGDRSGGTEQITTDRLEQCEIAAECLRDTGAGQIHLIAGTPYHTGNAEDFEQVIAAKVGGQFHSRGFFNINGREFNFKHKIGSSGIPHGRLTPLAREILQNREWYLEGTEPKADVLIRSHVHYYDQIDHCDCLGFITAGLQALGNKYGARQCSGVVHFGILVIDVTDKGEITWTSRKAQGAVQRSQSLAL